MNTVDAKSPVIIGVGQLSDRPTDLNNAVEALEMMAQVCETAATDAGNIDILKKADAIRVIDGAWSYSDPAGLLAQRWGAKATTGLSTNGGNTPQSLVTRSAADIAAGHRDIVVLVGAENIWSRRRARREGLWIDTTEQVDVDPDEILGTDVEMNTPFEIERGLEQPIHLYPIFESAIRHANGESIEAHRDRISTLWEGFNRVAVRNQYAWRRTELTAAEIRDATDANRMVGFPYTKAMNSNWDLSQAAAVIMCSAKTAGDLEVARDRWVFPWAGTDGYDTPAVTERENLHSSPAIRVAGARCMKLADAGPDDIAHVDLYSCFPSAVQIGASELGLSLDRQLTVTGGLTFAGGPLNNYVTHSIATMVDVLRSDPAAIGLCSANGGYTTKHAFGIYSTTPPNNGFKTEPCQDEIAKAPRATAVPHHVGPVTIEAYTVMHSKDGPEKALMALEAGPGSRTWGATTEPDVMTAMATEEFIGRTGHLDAGGLVTVD